MNEPQTAPFYEQKQGLRVGQLIADWAANISAFVKQNDPKHLVCLGEVSVPYHQKAYWGTDYEANIKVAGIDFGSMHLYPESWGIPRSVFSQPSLLLAQIAPFFDQALNATSAAGKPLMLQEYGCSSFYANRDIVLNAMHAAANARGLSSLVWQLVVVPQGPGDGWNFAYTDDGTSALKQQITYVNSLSTGGRK